MRNEDWQTQLVKAETVIKDYKVRQDIAGDSWRVYAGTTNNTPYDVRIDGTQTDATTVKRYKITYQVDGARNIPNAFAVFYSILDNTDEMYDYMTGGTYGQLRGFGVREVPSGEDPLVSYVMVWTEFNWTNTAASWIGLKFRALSPYQGSLKFEEIT